MRVINSEASKVILCRGALATERRLLVEVDRLATRDLDDLGAPVRIIVPSRSLRLHLMRRLVRKRGAVAGVVIQTMGGLAREIMERVGFAHSGRGGGVSRSWSGDSPGSNPFWPPNSRI